MSRPAVDGIVRPKGLRNRLLRLLLFFILGLFVLYYLLPLFVMVATSLKSLDEIRGGSLLSRPRNPSFDAWAKAWQSACVGVRCNGLAPYMWNSVAMVVPAVLISTALGAVNGYALTKWRFRGADTIFALMLFGAFIPFQVILLPMARTLGLLGLAGSVTGTCLRPYRLRVGIHHALLPQFLHWRIRWHRSGGEDRWRGLLPHLLPHSAADGAAGNCRDRDLAIHPDLERFPVRHRLHGRRQQSGNRRPQ